MKITKLPKRLAEPVPQVQKLLEQVMNASDDELANILDGIVEWCWPRGDLHFWVPALNRFDIILEETCRDYDLFKLQINEFTPLRKKLVISILNFSRLLIENSTSRKLYSSYEHLRNLLFARDVDILEATLRLFLRFAQQTSGQHPRAEILSSQERIATLALTWAPREHGLDSVELAKDSPQIPSSFFNVRFQFYRRMNAEVTKKIGPWANQEGGNSEDSPAVTPVRPRAPDRAASTNVGFNVNSNLTPGAASSSTNIGDRSSNSEEGLITIDLGNVSSLNQDPMDILADAVETHYIPEADQFELFQKIRFSTSLTNAKKRQQLLVCRLLAIACYAHITSENTASTQLFLYEPDLVGRIAALVKPEHGLPQNIVAGALYALDALGRYRSKLNEVLSSLTASVNHGVLMQVLRAIIEDLATGKPSRSDQLIDAFYGLVSFVTSTSVGSGLVVGAGLVQLLVQLINQAKPETYIVQRSMTRALGLLDSVIYAYLPAFNLFCQAQGLEVFVRRIEEEVESDIRANADAMQEMDESRNASDALELMYGKVPFGRAHLLRGFLQSISHMMVSTGTAEGLRNLIDTSMLTSIKSIMANRKVFGPQNLALSINIMATFVHNEPTSLGIIQEKKLPEAFLSLIKDEIEPHFDVINAVPNAVGALCLNQAGLDMFSAEPIIPKLLSLLMSEKHVKVLSDQDNVTVFGASIDELIRHQPTMKQSVIDGLVKVLISIQEAGKDFECPVTEDVSAYHLAMANSKSLEHLQSIRSDRVIAFGDVLADDSEVKKNEAIKDINTVAQYIDVTSRFLDIFFQSANHCKDFLKADGLVHLLNFYDLPCVSYNFGASTAADSIVHLLRFIAEISPTVVIQGLLGEVKKSIDETKALWGEAGNESKLIKLIAPLTDDELKNNDIQFRNLIKLNVRVQVLSDVAPSLTYTGSKTPAPFLQVINGTNSSGSTSEANAITLSDMALFYRSWVWESILFRAAAPPRATSIKNDTGSDEDKSGEQRHQNRILERNDLPVIMEVEGTEEGVTHDKQEVIKALSEIENRTLEKTDSIMKNAAALRYIASAVKLSLSSFFSETDRLLSSRRSHDPTHKRLTVLTANQIGKSLRDSVVWKEHEQTTFSCAYATSSLQQALKLLYDERPSNLGNAQTFVLVPFIREGGIEELINTCKFLLANLGSHFESDGRPKKSSDLNDAVQLGYICSGLKACLDLLLKLVSSKALLESPATQTMTSKESTKRTSSEFFDPYETLVKLRVSILPVILEFWNKNWLEHTPFGISRTVLQILLRVIEADGETKPPKRDLMSQSLNPLSATSALAGSSTAAGAVGLPAALANLSGALGPIRRNSPLVPDESRIRQLMDMGFPRRAARHALVRCANNLSAAAEYLLMHPEVVTSMMDDEPEPSTAAPAENATENAIGSNATAVESNSAIATTQDATQTGDVEAGSGGTGSSNVPQGDLNTNDHATGVESGATWSAESAQTEENANRTETQTTAQGDVEMSNINNADADTQMTTRSDSNAETKADADAAADFKRNIEILNESRAEIKKTLVPKALELAEKHDGLVFDVKSAVHLVSDSFANSEVLVSLFDQVEEKSSAIASTSVDRSISTRLHLLALIFHDTTVTIRLSPAKAKRFMNSLITLVDSSLTNGEKDSKPSWLASLLLVLTAVLRAEYEIESVKIEEKDADASSGVIHVAPSNLFDEDLPKLFDFCLIQLDHLNTLTRDDWLALYRFLVILTRRASIGLHFKERKGLSRLMKPFSTLDPEQISGCRALSLMILRNVLESDARILRMTMTQEIFTWFSHQRTKTIDTTTMSRALSYAMLRDPNTFIDVLAEYAHLVDYNVNKGQGYIKFVDPAANSANSNETQNRDSEPHPFIPPLVQDAEESMDVTTVSPTKSIKVNAQRNGNTEEVDLGKGKSSIQQTTSENNATSDAFMQYLLSELIRSSREVITAKKAPNTRHQQQQSEQMDIDSMDKKEEKTKGENKDREKQVFYTSFLLQTLTELLSSYVPCKTSFLNSTKRKAAGSTLLSGVGVGNQIKKDSTPSKTKGFGSILSFFLGELIPSGFLMSREHEEMRRMMTISNWGMSVIVALCADVGSSTVKENHGEVIQTRRHVLDAIAKAFKESTTASPLVNSSNQSHIPKQVEPTEMRYGRLYSLADLTYRLLKAQPNTNPSTLSSSRPWDDSMLNMAKTMLERNFVTTLTSALAEVDLNLPMVKPLLDRILKPLEYLTKIAIKMNRAERKGEKHRGALIDSDDTGSFTSDDSMDHEEMDEDEEDEETDGHHRSRGDADGREETPDFYRNSSLGMHTGDLEGGQIDYDEDDEDDEDEDEEMDDDIPPMGFDDERTDDSDDSDEDVEERIVEVLEEDDEDEDMTDSDSSDDEEDSDEDDDEEEWMDEEDDDGEIHLDDDDEEDDDDSDDDDEEGEALDFIIEGDPDHAHELFEHAGHIFHDHARAELEPGGIVAPIMVEEGEEEEDEEDEEAMEEDSEGSVLEEVFEDGLQPLGLLDPLESFNAAPVDRFGANWGWTNVPDPASGLLRGSNARTDLTTGDQQQDATPTTINPLTFIRQRASSSRHSRSRRLLDWDAGAWETHPLSSQALPGGGRAYAITGSTSLMGDRSMGGNAQDVASHPLLYQDNPADLSRAGNTSARLHRSLATRRDHSRRHGGERDHDWARSLEEMMEGGAMQFLETILSRSGAAGMLGNTSEPIRISLTSQGGVPRMSIGGQTITRGLEGGFGLNRRSNGQDGNSSNSVSVDKPVDIVAIVQEFVPMQTFNRWSDASKIVHGPQAHERGSSLRPYIINALRPGYLKDQQELKRKRDELEEEKRKNSAELEKAQKEKERVERELDEARAQFEALRRTRESEIERRATGNEVQTPSQNENNSSAQAADPQNIDAGDVEMTEGAQQEVANVSTTSTGATPPNLELASLQQGLDELDTSVSSRNGGEQNQSSAERETVPADAHNEGEGSVPNSEVVLSDQQTQQEQSTQRITTIINGSEIDITDSGIDPTFLEALPEDMREEVLNQHFRERRAAAAAAAATAAADAMGESRSSDPSRTADTTSIAPEFLDALPPEIRAEVIQQEAQDRVRRRMEEARRENRRNGAEGNNEGSGGPSDIDPVSFLATLAPELRSAVLMDQDQSFLDSLPTNMLPPDVDEARRTQRRHVDMRRLHRRFDATGLPIEVGRGETTGQTSSAADGNANGASSTSNNQENGKEAPAVSRDAIQLLDKSGIAALVRLMFFPQMDAQQSGLRHVMINLAENGKTRHELLNLLLLMLADSCSAESNAVDRSYTHMSGRVNNTRPMQTPSRPTARRMNSTPGSANATSSAFGQQVHFASHTPSQNPAFVAPISRTGDEAPFLIASRSIEMLVHLAGANERAAYYFLRDDPNNHSLMKWFKKNAPHTSKGKEKGSSQTSTAPINILLILLAKPSILGNAQLVDSLIALLNTVTRPLPTIAVNVKKAEEASDKTNSLKDKKDIASTSAIRPGALNENESGMATTETSNQPQETNKSQVNDDSNSSSSLPNVMPNIAAERMAAVVKPLSTSISSKGFQNTLAVASNLSTIDGARDLITDALQNEAKMASRNLLNELDLLLESLPPAPIVEGEEEDHNNLDHQNEGFRRMSQAGSEQTPIVQQTGQQRQAIPTQHINSPALTQLASPSSSQTVILRSLRALEWVITRPKPSTSNPQSSNGNNTGTGRHHQQMGGTTIRLI